MKQVIDFTDPNLYVDWVHEFTDAMYNPDIRYIWMKGGAGAGKSHLVGQYVIQDMFYSRIGVFRKTKSSIYASCFLLVDDYRRKRGMDKYIDKLKVGEFVTTSGMCKMFGMDDEEKIKSITDFDWFWIEEANELTYDEFTQLDLRLRGKKNHKIVCTFNPVSSKSRLKTEIYDNPAYRHNSVFIEKTARQNKFVDSAYLANLESLKEKNPTKYKIYALNEWGEGLKGLIYKDYTVFDYDIEPQVIGLDFGYNHPTALMYVSIIDAGPIKDLYAQEKIYKKEMTGPMLIQEMDSVGVPKHIPIIADSSRPELIEDIRKAGYKIFAADKGQGSVKEGIDQVMSHNIHINGENTQTEIKKYVWKLDKNGNPVDDEPVKMDDDAMDAIRYAIYNKPKEKKFYFE